MTKNDIPTPEEIHELFEINESLIVIQENISKYNAVTDIFAEALESCKNSESIPNDDTFFWVASVLRDYGEKALSGICETHSKYNQMYSKKKALCFGGEIA